MVLNQKKVYLKRIGHVANAHVGLVKEIGTALLALEAEYLKCKQSLDSAQAREALRLIVEQALVQITALTTSSTPSLPTFTLQRNGEVRHRAARPDEEIQPEE